MNIRLKSFFLVFGTLMLPNLVSAAPVKSISLEVFKDGAERFWEVSVNCEGLNQPRLMRHPIEDGQWCSNDIKNLCDKNKFSLSRKLCDDNFNQQVVNFQNSPLSTQANNGSVVSKIEKKPVEEIGKVAKTKTPSAIQVNRGQVASPENLLKEKMQIEEQRILIEQKRLELRRRELSLQKQQLNGS